MSKTVIKNGIIINEGKEFVSDILIEDDLIAKIENNISEQVDDVVDAEGAWVIPGIIDDQVHFREPGLTHKADIQSESAAAVAGGITSFMEMPNTIPHAVTQNLLEDKYQLAAEASWANYSFFMGATNNNLEEVLKTDGKNVCGIKIFMGASTGNMLVDNDQALEDIFSNTDLLIATHCEDEGTIQRNLQQHKEKYGDNIPIEKHPVIRSQEACYLSSSKAVALAKKTNARLHVLHISTEKEISLFEPGRDFNKKRITAEACTHHLWFSDEDYTQKGTHIKWNPAIKTAQDRDAVWQGLIDDRIDVMATDHAPHTVDEKNNKYAGAPSGGPMVQHALPAALSMAEERKIPFTRIVDKMCHAPADLFSINKRGYIKEGYYADIAIVRPKKWKVTEDQLYYKCGWSPMTGITFDHYIDYTLINGEQVYHNGKHIKKPKAKRLQFNR